MKRIISIFFIFFFCITFIYSVEANPDRQMSQVKEIKIQGGYNSVAALNIKPIPAQTESYMIGMPFPINDISVRAKQDYKGRLIANWNILSNKAFLLDVYAEILHNYGDTQYSDHYVNGLGYTLSFTYNVSYFSKGQSYYSPDETYVLKVPNDPNLKIQKDLGVDLFATLPDYDKTSLVGSAEGEIYFCFDEATTLKIEDESLYNNLPDGNYSAQVVLVMKPIEVQNVNP